MVSRGQLWSPVPPCGGAGNRLPHPPLGGGGCPLASGWEGRGRVRGSTDQRLALTHPAFPFSHLLPFSSLHLSCLLVSTLSSGCRLVHTHRAHQPRHAGWPRRPGCAPACAPYTPSLPWTRVLVPPSCTAMLSILLTAQAASTLGTHLALRAQAAAENHSPGFWHSQGFNRAALGTHPLPCALGSRWKQTWGAQ